jgi:hypothetical protein
MRAVHDSSPKFAAILTLLQAWKQLPESDISSILRTYHLITDDFRDMEDQGYITMSYVGDEYIIAPTMLGRIWLEQYNTKAEA